MTEPGRLSKRNGHEAETPEALLELADALADHGRLLELADALAGHAAAVRESYEELGRSLGAMPVAGRPTGESASADLLTTMAVDMAVSGRTRREVRTYLRDAFGVIDTESVLDEAFGEEGERRPGTRPRRVRRLAEIGRGLVRRA